MTDNFIIKKISRFSEKTLKDLNNLLLQISTSGYQMDSTRLKKVIKNKNTYLMALYEGEKIIGTITLVSVFQIRDHKGYVENFVIDENYRGRKLGRKMISYITELAKRIKIEKLELKSESHRVVANMLYKKLGFNVVSANVYDMKL